MDCECRERLADLLKEHQLRIGKANDYLVNIKNAITENRLENLQQSLSNPELSIEDIEQLEQQRHQLLASYGFTEDYDGFEKCISWCDNEQGQLSKLYQQLIESLVQLQHSIQVNNLLVSKGRDRVRRSIGILTGLGSGGNCKTYSSSGKALEVGGRRNIAVA